MAQLNVFSPLPPIPSCVSLPVRIIAAVTWPLPHPTSCHCVTDRQEGQCKGWQWLMPAPITVSLDATSKQE